MASIRDLLVGAIVSGAVTFGTTFYFDNREHNQRLAEQTRALEEARAQNQTLVRRENTSRLYREFQAPVLAAKREAFVEALRAHPHLNYDAWDSGVAVPEAGATALNGLLGFYSDLAISLDAGELDANLARDLFGRDVRWWYAYVLPDLCQGMERRAEDRFGVALHGFELIAGTAPSPCPPGAPSTGDPFSR